MKLVELLKSNSLLRRVVKRTKIKKEYYKDYKQFSKYYMDSSNGINQTEYRIIFIAHSIEKGMTHKNLRPFGEKKINDILNNLIILDNFNVTKSTAYSIGYNILIQWKNLYDINNWYKTNCYIKVTKYLENTKHNFVECKVGSFVNTKDEYSKYYNFDYLDAIQTRHSVRDFKIKEINQKDLKYCIQSAIWSPSACNRQMCKIYYVKSNNKKKELSDAIMGLTGFNNESINLFLITYDISAFLFFGERNQGYFNAGLFAMNFVNALHFRGIGSCFLQWGNKHSQEKSIKKILGIPKNEKIVISIAAGYYKDNTLVPRSQRKKISEIYKEL